MRKVVSAIAGAAGLVLLCVVTARAVADSALGAALSGANVGPGLGLIVTGGLLLLAVRRRGTA